MSLEPVMPESNRVWILWEWSVGKRDQSVVGVFSTWESAREEANLRRKENMGKEHDWEEWELKK